MKWSKRKERWEWGTFLIFSRLTQLPSSEKRKEATQAIEVFGMWRLITHNEVFMPTIFSLSRLQATKAKHNRARERQGGQLSISAPTHCISRCQSLIITRLVMPLSILCNPASAYHLIRSQIKSASGCSVANFSTYQIMLVINLQKTIWAIIITDPDVLNVTKNHDHGNK